MGNRAEFALGNELLFGVLRKRVHHGREFGLEALAGDLMAVNLDNYPEGVIVTLKQNASSGEYAFSAKAGSFY